jgi:hypothetical protein
MVFGGAPLSTQVRTRRFLVHIPTLSLVRFYSQLAAMTNHGMVIIELRRVPAFTRECVKRSILGEMLPEREIDHFCDDVYNYIIFTPNMRVGPMEQFVWSDNLYKVSGRHLSHAEEVANAITFTTGHAEDHQGLREEAAAAVRRSTGLISQ